jgi:hypothetical protein
VATVVATRRLPGVIFEPKPPPSRRVLPRMDVAAFVGFAAAGPLDVPVAVADAAQFAAVFGEDTPLAWDEARGERVHAQLGPAVRAFFRNGGRRAWVVRVAGTDAQRSVVPVPGLLMRAPGGQLGPAALAARSRGSWADSLRVGAALSSVPAVLVAARPELLSFIIEAPAGALAPGDLLRLRGDQYELLFVAARVQTTRHSPDGTKPRPGRTHITVVGESGTALWLEHTATIEGSSSWGSASYVDGAGDELWVPAHVPDADSPPSSPPGPGQPVELELEIEVALAPQPGTLVRVAGLSAEGTRVLWLKVDTLGDVDEATVSVGGRAAWQLAEPPALLPVLDETWTVERLNFELWAHRGEAEGFVLDMLGFAPGHPRYVGDLPTDEELYTPREFQLEPDPELRTASATPRFPLAGFERDRAASTVYYPLWMDIVPETTLGPLRTPGSPLERDGLVRFGDALFLDPALRGVGTDTLVATAEYLRWQSPTPRRLSGVHALLEVDEVTLVAVPDAASRRWQERKLEKLPEPPPSDDEQPAPSGCCTDETSDFVDCVLMTLEPTPVLSVKGPDTGGSFELAWTNLDGPNMRYVLEESTDPSGWKHAEAVYTGPNLSVRLYGRSGAVRFYRVRAELGPNVSAWSNGAAVRAENAPEFVLEPETDYEADGLLAVQRGLLRLCASRGDMLGVLSVPEHYREQAAIGHAGRLRSGADPFPLPQLDPGLDRVLPLDAGEQRTLGFGALYHPWLVLSQSHPGEPFRRVAPDGTVAGVVARRAATRGAWIAPANDRFVDVIALVHPAGLDALGPLQEAQVNAVRQEPGGFLCLCEDTLAPDEEVRQICVRRLLALVRRLVLLEGVEYVFEPNDPVFRRAIERGFREILQTLYQLGAFTGRTPEQAYRVNVGDPPNTPASVDQGRLIVELKLAPSRPLAFLNVRLIHTGERGFAIEIP